MSWDIIVTPFSELAENIAHISQYHCEILVAIVFGLDNPTFNQKKIGIF